MRYIPKRPFSFRYRRTAGKRRRWRWVLILAAVLLTFWGILCEAGISSVSPELTEEAAREYLLSNMNRAIEENWNKEQESFVTVGHSAADVSSVTIDAAALNGLKSGIVSQLAKSLNGKATAWIPAGSLTSVGIFNGRGPKVPIRLNLEGSADVSFQTEFRSAGINQSCHRVVMTVTARVFSQSKRFQVLAQEETSTVLAETVVVGGVPNVALSELK